MDDFRGSRLMDDLRGSRLMDDFRGSRLMDDFRHPESQTKVTNQESTRGRDPATRSCDSLHPPGTRADDGGTVRASVSRKPKTHNLTAPSFPQTRRDSRTITTAVDG
ncbi:hypothetical protein F2Q70_00019999 [Brassica cretica]|uniref:Uncharacterized protein n=1 Tax=Brassica cretica TaxID=69181 RepID=A0A8S9GMR7_BRACR|nr:hypothetical protein F2Q70_00019999 [Brassica cretica]